MKKFAILFGFICLLAAGVQAQNGNFQSAGNRAEAAAHACVQPYRIGNHHVEHELVLIADCIGGRTGYGFNIWVVYDCHVPPGAICDPLRPVLAAFVYINCEGEVETVECR